MLDYHVILDMVPQIALLYFTGRLSPAVSVTGVQASLLLAIGLQRKVLEDVETELGLPVSQLLAMFVKVVRKASRHFRTLVEEAVQETMPAPVTSNGNGLEQDVEERFRPLPRGLDEELREGGEDVNRELKEKQKALIDALPLDKYAVPSVLIC